VSVTAEDLIKNLAAKAVASLGGAGSAAPAAAEPKPAEKTGQVLVAPAVVSKYWAEHMDWTRIDSPEAFKAACDATITQLGAVNFHNWRATGGPEQMIADAKEARKVGGPDDPNKYDEQGNLIPEVAPPVVPDVLGDAEKQALAMSKRVEDLDRKLREFDTGHGAKGAAARLGIALAGTEATVIEGVATAKTAVEVPLDHVTSALTGGTPEKGKEAAEKAKGVKHEVSTTIKVALGDYQAIFDKTRPGYQHFVAARDRYHEARKTCLATAGDLSQTHNDAMKALDDALEAMKQAESEFEASAGGVDIDEQLKRINEWSDTTSKGAAGDITKMGVEVVGGEIMAEGNEAMEDVEESTAKNMTEEEVKEAERKAEEATGLRLKEKAVEYIKDKPKEKLQELPGEKAEDGIRKVAATNAGGQKAKADSDKKE
jgi:hypothetical protein